MLLISEAGISTWISDKQGLLSGLFSGRGVGVRGQKRRYLPDSREAFCSSEPQIQADCNDFADSLSGFHLRNLMNLSNQRFRTLMKGAAHDIGPPMTYAQINPEGTGGSDGVQEWIYPDLDYCGEILAFC